MPWRVTPDTNVLVSGVLSPRGAPGYLLQLWMEGAVDLVLCEEIIHEYTEVLSRPRIQTRYRLITAQTIAASTAALRAYAVLVVPADIPAAVGRDPEDNVILACAATGGADYIVTRDEDLLSLRECQQIPIVTPEVFSAVYRSGAV